MKYLPRVQGQWWPGGDNPGPRSGRGLGGATLRLRPVAARRRRPVSEVRGGDPEEPPMTEARAGGWEEQPEEGWLRRHRRA